MPLKYVSSPKKLSFFILSIFLNKIRGKQYTSTQHPEARLVGSLEAQPPAVCQTTAILSFYWKGLLIWSILAKSAHPV